MTTTVKAIRIEEFGGPEKMQLVETQVGEPGPGARGPRNNRCHKRDSRGERREDRADHDPRFP